MSVGNANLIVQEGPGGPQEITLTLQNTLIGRTETADITFDDTEISRQHAQIIRQGDDYFIEDQGSTNGTFVNGHRAGGRTALNDGDIIDLGDAVRMVFRYDIAREFPTMADPNDMMTIMEPTSPFQAAEPKPELTGTAVFEAPLPSAAEPNRRRLILGCGCGLLILVFLCAGLLFFLDSYESGRLLYCGGLRPLFETILGPVGFNPVCG